MGLQLLGQVLVQKALKNIFDLLINMTVIFIKGSRLSSWRENICTVEVSDDVRSEQIAGLGFLLNPLLINVGEGSAMGLWCSVGFWIE